MALFVSKQVPLFHAIMSSRVVSVDGMEKNCLDDGAKQYRPLECFSATILRPISLKSL